MAYSGHHPILLSMNCRNGYFWDVYADSLAEALLKAPDGGAVAVLAFSALSDTPGQSAFDQTFYSLALRQNLPIGDVFLQAKAAVNDPNVRKGWILFGDPTLRLR